MGNDLNLAVRWFEFEEARFALLSVRDTPDAEPKFKMYATAFAGTMFSASAGADPEAEDKPTLSQTKVLGMLNNQLKDLWQRISPRVERLETNGGRNILHIRQFETAAIRINIVSDWGETVSTPLPYPLRYAEIASLDELWLAQIPVTGRDTIANIEEAARAALNAELERVAALIAPRVYRIETK